MTDTMMIEATIMIIKLQFLIKLDAYPMDFTLSGVKLVWSLLSCFYSYPRSNEKPCTPFICIIGASIVFTLSVLPTLIWANCNTPNISRPTILAGKAEAIKRP
jgi:hypothetical protein